MMPLPKNHTHLVWAYQRTGKKHGRLIECGSGRIDRDTNVTRVVMNHQPIGGYTGYIQLLPFGMKPAPQVAQPEQTAESDEDEAAGSRTAARRASALALNSTFEKRMLMLKTALTNSPLTGDGHRIPHHITCGTDRHHDRDKEPS